MKQILNGLKSAFVVVPVLVLVLAAGAAKAGEKDQKLYQQTMPAVAWVISPLDDNTDAEGTGTLVTVGGQSLVLTACHVVEDRPNVVLFFPTKDDNGLYVTSQAYYAHHVKELAIPGQVVYRDPGHDVALIRPGQIPPGVHPLELASHDPKKGDLVYLTGNSGIFNGLLWNYRRAVVEDVGRDKATLDNGQHLDSIVLLIVGHVDHGDSGGPVFNEQGQVVGIISNGQDAAIDFEAIDALEVQGAMLGHTPGHAPSAPLPHF